MTSCGYDALRALKAAGEGLAFFSWQQSLKARHVFLALVLDVVMQAIHQRVELLLEVRVGRRLVLELGQLVLDLH